MTIDMVKRPLSDRKDSAEISLVKILSDNALKGVDLGDITAQIVLAVDYSGSMEDRYDNHEVQVAAERCLAMAMAGLDDDAAVQIFFFHNGVFAMEEVTPQNYAGFVETWRQNKRMGGTNYMPVLRAIHEFLDQEKMLDPNQPPVLLVFITDGQPGDGSAVLKFFPSIARLPWFTQFVCLGSVPSLLDKLNKAKNSFLDNVGVTHFKDTLQVTDEAFTEDVCREFFSTWLPAARQKGVTLR